MRLALLSDIHGNLHALEACLAHARARQAQRFAFLGDLVGYGADPVAVLDRVMLLTEEGALAIKGNHDAMAVNPPAEVKTIGDSTAGWTHQQLKTSHLLWLDNLPMTEHLESVLLVHASADAPERWHYVYDGRSATASLDAASDWTDVRYVFGGHVHEQNLYYRGADKRLMKFSPEPGVAVPVPKHRQWLSTVGSVGQPRDGRPDAMYAMFDTERAQLTFHRVPYDYSAAAKAIRLAGLPEYFAERLERGR
ncbi:MAG: metallophosphoesterase family protein [Rhodoferax sp.]|nr:metallophosphoesterase family protein [Rhodoferax sp.]